MKNYFRVSKYRNMMMRAYRKREPQKDMWGIGSYSALCEKEDGQTYIPGSIEKHLTRVKKCLSKGIDQFLKRKSVSKEHKLQLEHFKRELMYVGGSNGISKIVEFILDATQLYKEY
ncbi:MAG: hypothetical protein KDC79_08520 [Cyclobacteriaceae bacterium]|nr:hypothetical protein [Cyclobacteriaceae bacterium]